MLVASDADLCRAAEAAITGGYAFAGQACISVQRVYLHESIAEEFTRRIAAAVGDIRADDPSDPATVVGPLVSREALDRL